MCFVGYEDRSILPSRDEEERLCKSAIRLLLSQEQTAVATNWDVINGLLKKLPVATRSCNTTRCSVEQEDPMGRLLLGSLLSKNPPLTSVMYALQAFPDALHHNPAAFFTACRDASPQTLGLMMRHYCTTHTTSSNSNSSECPYPWILSRHVSLEGAQALLDANPQGVLNPCPSLSGFSLVDYFLLSSDMMEQRNVFDILLWNKFKLILLAASFCDNQTSRSSRSASPEPQLSPVHVILKRILSSRDFLTNHKNQAPHVLWLLHQLRWTDQWVFEKQDIDGNYPLQFVLSHPCNTTNVVQEHQGSSSCCVPVARELVKILIEAHPESVRHVSTNMDGGRLALHMAVEQNWPCHDLLLSVFPEALQMVDPKTELFPFQTAAARAAAAGVKEQPPQQPYKATASFCESLDVTYELLRANPTLHAYCALEIK
jgi:hypothetical protein